jgi:hypothetical protein
MGGGRVYVELKNAANKRRFRKLRRVRARSPVGTSGCSEEAEEEVGERGDICCRRGVCGDRVLRIRSALPCQIYINPRSQEVESQGASEPLPLRCLVVVPMQGASETHT